MTTSAPRPVASVSRAPSAPANRTRPGGCGKLPAAPPASTRRRRAPVRRLSRRSAFGGAGPDHGDGRKPAAEPSPPELLHGPGARQRRASRSPRARSAAPRSARCEREGTPRRSSPASRSRSARALDPSGCSRENDLHAPIESPPAARRRSVIASAPVRRSSQDPSSAATSAVSDPPSWNAATGARHPPPILRDAGALGSRPARASRDRPHRRRATPLRAHLERHGPLSRLGHDRAPGRDVRRSRRRGRAGRDRRQRERSRRALAPPRLRSRVSTLPRSGSTESDGSSASSCAFRRAEAVPIRIPARMPPAPHSASRGSSRAKYAPTARPPVSVEVMSFAECTAMSTRPASSASSSSLTNTPRSPISPNGRSSDHGRRRWSMGTSATSSSGRAARIASRRDLGLDQRQPAAARAEADEHRALALVARRSNRWRTVSAYAVPVRGGRAPP